MAPVLTMLTASNKSEDLLKSMLKVKSRVILPKRILILDENKNIKTYLTEDFTRPSYTNDFNVEDSDRDVFVVTRVRQQSMQQLLPNSSSAVQSPLPISSSIQVSISASTPIPTSSSSPVTTSSTSQVGTTSSSSPSTDQASDTGQAVGRFESKFGKN